jgi:hypothetical protein
MAGPTVGVPLEQHPTTPPMQVAQQVMMAVPLGPHQLGDPNATQSAAAQTGIGGRMLAMWIGGAALVGLMVSVLGALVLGPSEAPVPTETKTSTVSTSPAPRGSSDPRAPSPKAPVKSEGALSLEERAATGDSEAMRLVEVESLTERKASQIVALAKGRSAQKRHALDAVGRELRSNLPLSADRETLARLRPYTQDRETATEALAVLASLHTPMAGDMLYEIWTGARGKTDTSELARDLLYTKEVKDSVSEALAVALDLQDARTCEDVEKTLPRAREHGDMRSLILLGKLNFRYGCGSRGGQDCYPCLRGTTAINDAIQAVRGRPAPGI